jgi:hypothetical protein
MQVRPVRSRRPLKPIPQEQLDKLWLEVVAGLGAGGIESRRIDDDDEPGAVTYGVCESGNVTIDEPAHIVETLIHELVHRQRPTWSERRVRQAEQRLYGRLTRDDIETLHTIYLSVRRKRRKAKVL